jgi:hypothetical protein
VTKLNPTGSDLLYSGCLDGLNAKGHDVVLDDAGQAYVVGMSGDGLPVTSGAYQATHAGGDDAFLAVVSSDGATLAYATYLGGSSVECSYVGYEGRGCTLDLDDDGDVYITGGTRSDDLPTQGAYDASCGSDGTCNNNWDAFLAKLSPDGSGAADLLYATYLGGANKDYTSGIAVDGDENAYVTGATASTADFPVTSGVFGPAHHGGYADAFVAKLNAAGNGLVYSSYLGGSGGNDYGWDIAVDLGGQAYVVGRTSSSDFPLTGDAVDTTLGQADVDAYVVKVNANGSALAYATYLGGDEPECTNGCAIALDAAENVYVVGDTGSAANDFPTSANAYDTTFNGTPQDAFMVRLPTARHRLYLPLTLRAR